MPTGVVSTTTTDWSGGTLTAAVAATDTVLYVDEVVDFDDDENNDNRWLVIADSSTPLKYVDVDEDAGTVTLAAAAGAAYESGLPVDVWDASVAGGGARVVEYTAKVERDDDEDSAPVTITIPPERAPSAGVDLLIGARVEFDYNDEDVLELGRVIGRKAVVDSSFISTPLLRAHLAANVSVVHGTLTNVSGWTTTVSRGITLSSGWATVSEAGVYTVVLSAAWEPNSTGSRYTIIRSRDAALVEATERQVAIPSSTGITIVVQATAILELEAGAAIRMQVQQTSGAALNLAGAADGRLTAFEMYRGAVE